MSFEEVARRLPHIDQKIIKGMMELFDGTDRRTEKFAAQAGLRCKNGCGACCENPQVETTVSEALPLAVHLWSLGVAPEKIQALQETPAKSVCMFYKPGPSGGGQGRCGVYRYRPGLCRLFGFAARKDKYGRTTLTTCKIIKKDMAYSCAKAQESLDQGTMEAPLMSTHALAVADIDPVHGRKTLPINRAVQLALERIGYYLEKFPQ